MVKRIQMSQVGGPEVLELVEGPSRAPGPGQVRVAVEAAGVNFIDIYFRTGAYPATFPFSLGLEGAGRVVEVGAGVSGFAAGDRVAWAQLPGSYAQEVTTGTQPLVRVPDGVGLQDAAAVMLQGMTAHYLVRGVREAHAGEVALVHAAAGGTGLLLVQMLTRAGVRVLGTCSTPAKAELVRQAGADEVILYTQQDFAKEARRLTSGRGVDVVYDSVGKATFDGSLGSLRVRGMMVLFGQSSGEVPALDPQRLNRGGGLFLTRPSLVHYTSDPEERDMRAGEVLQAVASGDLKVRIGARYGLAQAAQAQTDLAARATTGKLLLTTA